jgi:hypothetical protein
MTVNALDFLTETERNAVENYTLDIDIRDKLNKATTEAIARGESLYLPAGLWLIRANTRTTRTSTWVIDVPDRRSIIIFGDGDATIVRRQGTSQMEAASPLVQIVANSANQLTFQNLLFDGNEANCPIDEGIAFFYEQSANILFAPGSGIPDNITFNNVTMTGCVADGFKANVPIQSLQVTNWRSYGRTRRPRADIQLSRIPLQVTNITNFIGDAFEMEPSETNTEHIINLSNMLVRGAFDLAGDSGETLPNFANVNATNIKHLGQLGVGLSPGSNFFRVRGNFNNCSFVDTARIQSCDIRFDGGSFTVSGKVKDSSTAQDILIIHGGDDESTGFTDGKFIEFNGVTFKVRGTRVKTGAYFLESKKRIELKPQTWFINCRAIDELDYFAISERNGTMLFDGGQLKGRIAAISISSGTGGNSAGKPYVTKAIVKNIELWSSKFAIEIGGVGNPVQIEMSGFFNAETIQPLSNTSPRTSPNITWIGGFIGSVTSDPNGRIAGLPGLILRKSEPIVPAPTDSDRAIEWRYQKGKTYAAKDYVATVIN